LFCFDKKTPHPGGPPPQRTVCFFFLGVLVLLGFLFLVVVVGLFFLFFVFFLRFRFLEVILLLIKGLKKRKKPFFCWFFRSGVFFFGSKNPLFFVFLGGVSIFWGFLFVFVAKGNATRPDRFSPPPPPPPKNPPRD